MQVNGECLTCGRDAVLSNRKLKVLAVDGDSVFFNVNQITLTVKMSHFCPPLSLCASPSPLTLFQLQPFNLLKLTFPCQFFLSTNCSLSLSLDIVPTLFGKNNFLRVLKNIFFP